MSNRILDTQRAAGGNAIFDEVGASSAPQVNLAGTTTTQSATSGTGIATVTAPAAGVINLVGTSTTQGSTSGTGAAGVVHTPKTINLVGSSSTQGAVSGTGAAAVYAAGSGESVIVPASRTVRFGATERIVRFGGHNRVVRF